jgi:hypothetical protein
MTMAETSRVPELNDEQWLKNAYVRDEMSIREIADALFCAEDTVLRAMKRWGIPRRSAAQAAGVSSSRRHASKKPRADPKGRSMVPELNDRAWLDNAYWCEGRSMYEIADMLACGAPAVRRAMKRHGIPTRSRKEAAGLPRSRRRCSLGRRGYEALKEGP